MNAKRFRRNPDVVTRTIGAETLLVPVGQSIVDLSRLFTLNDTGNFIWQQLSDPRGASEIAAALADEFDVPADQAERDVVEFLEELAGQRCILEVAADEEG